MSIGNAGATQTAINDKAQGSSTNTTGWHYADVDTYNGTKNK